MNESVIERAQLLHQESEGLEERLRFIDQQLSELTQFNVDLGTLSVRTSNEMLASLGRGVFARCAFVGTELFVDIGAGVIVKKTVPEVRTIISGQLQNLQTLRAETHEQLQKMQREFEHILRDVEMRGH